jgi:phosphoketolase
VAHPQALVPFQGADNLHVRGDKEKGNINALLELAMLNEASRATRHWQIPRT